jgi:hypothetical protein
MSRKRGRIVLVGVTGLALNRADFYEKELTFQVSCSYGPGRYDSAYEENGHDYPIGYVRWTEQLNFQAVLEMLASGRLSVRPLLSHRVRFKDAPRAYGLLVEDKTALGILLTYSSALQPRMVKSVSLSAEMSYLPTKPVLGFIVAGNYALWVLNPAFKRAGAQFHTVVSRRGVSGVVTGRRSGFIKASTDVADILSSDHINTAVVVTRHNSNADFFDRALPAGKHAFIEKPLPIDIDRKNLVRDAYQLTVSTEQTRQLMADYNRPSASQAKKIKSLLASMKDAKIFFY